MPMSRALSAFTALMFVGSANAFIFEDNPPSIHVRFAPAHPVGWRARPHAHPAPQHVNAWLQQVRWESCDGSSLTVLVEEYVDLLDGFDLDAPEGNWCAIEPELLDVELSYADGGPTSINLDSSATTLEIGEREEGFVFMSDAVVGDMVLMGDANTVPVDAQ